jgi:hypothetical protein
MVMPALKPASYKLLQTCKPDFVPCVNKAAIIYLSRQLLTGINLPTLQCSRFDPGSGEQPSALVYVAFQHARFARE